MIETDNPRAHAELLAIRAGGSAWSELPRSSDPLDATTHTPSHPATSPPSLGPAESPDRLLQGARACLRRGRTRDAATLMELACDVAPLDVRCRAMLAWLRVQCGEARLAVVAEPLLEVLTRAVSLYPDDLELRMHRAGVLQRLGRDAAALLDFSFVAAADPCNTEAAGQVRRHYERYGLTGSGVFALERGSRAPARSIVAPSGKRAAPASDSGRARTKPRSA